MFDPVNHTQGGYPHLIQHMTNKYRAQGELVNAERAKQGMEPIDCELAIQAAKPLLDFFEQYLRICRPVGMFPIDMNYGITLSDNSRVAVCPGTGDIQGTMQDSGAVQVYDGKTQLGQEGVIPFQGFGVG